MKRRIYLWLRKYLDDLLFTSGFILILIGSYCLHPIAAWFVAGAECLIAGFVIAWSKRK